MRGICRLLLVFATVSLAIPPLARAADESVDMTVEQALTYRGKRSVLDMPFHLRGADHGKIADSIAPMTTRQTTRSFARSDEHSCGIAFQSAIIRLQERARELGGDAVVDIVSLVDGSEVEVPLGFRCRVGNFVATVSLAGRAVKLAD